MSTRLRNWLIGIAALFATGLPTAVAAASLYVTEYVTVASIGSLQTPWVPGKAVAAQKVTISGTSAQSAAFNASTHVVRVYCDVGCSIAFSTSPTATTDDAVLTAQQPEYFVVVPGTKVAGVTNASGDLP